MTPRSSTSSTPRTPTAPTPTDSRYKVFIKNLIIDYNTVRFIKPYRYPALDLIRFYEMGDISYNGIL